MILFRNITYDFKYEPPVRWRCCKEEEGKPIFSRSSFNENARVSVSKRARAKNNRNIWPYCLQNVTYSIVIVFYFLWHKSNITLQVMLLYWISAWLWLATARRLSRANHSSADIQYHSTTLSVIINTFWPIRMENSSEPWLKIHVSETLPTFLVNSGSAKRERWCHCPCPSVCQMPSQYSLHQK